jgi:penicillin-binding protein 1A
MRRSPRLQDSPADTPRRTPDELASKGDCGHRRAAEVSDITGVQRPPGTEAAGMRQARPGDLHTAMAGRALFSAVKADLTAFGRRLGILLSSALASRRRSEATRACAHGSGTTVRCRGAVA